MSVQSFDPNKLNANPDISMTDAAIKHFSKQLGETSASFVRLFIEESGCSGYMYRVALIEKAEPSDIELPQQGGPTLYVQAESLSILQGTVIDFKRDGLNEVVKFNNPNVTAECGCGESFVVEPD